MAENKNYGRLLQGFPLELQIKNFKECCNLIGVNVEYYPPITKEYNLHGEIDATYNYDNPEVVGCIFEEYIPQATAKKLGWNSEQQEKSSIIHVPYDLHDLQVGCVFKVPSAIPGAPGRLFRVAKMLTIMIYPASISCELVQEYETTMSKSDTESFKNSDFKALFDENELNWRYKK